MVVGAIVYLGGKKYLANAVCYKSGELLLRLINGETKIFENPTFTVKQVLESDADAKMFA